MHLTFRRLLFLSLVAAIIPACSSSSSFIALLPPLARLVYVPNDDGTVSAFAATPPTGVLSSQGYAACYVGSPTANAQRVAVSPGGTLAWVLRTGGAPTLSAFTVNTTTGALTSSGAPMAVAGITNAVAIAVDPLVRFVYVLDGAAAGAVQVYSIGANGVLTAVGTPVSAGTAPTNPSAIVVHPSGSFIYLTNQNSGSGTIAGFSVGGGGALTAIAPAITGSGPVDLKIDPTGQYLIAVCINDADLWVYTVNTSLGVLTTVAGSPFPAGVTSPRFVAIDPLNRFVWAGNAAGSVATLDFNVTTGFLFGPPGNVSVLAFNPSAFTPDPSGQYGFFSTINGAMVTTSIEPNGTLGATFTSSVRARNVTPGPAAIVSSTAPVTHTPTAVYAGSTGGLSAYEIAATTGLLTAAPGSPYLAGSAVNSVAVDPYGRFAYSTTPGAGPNPIGQFTVSAGSGILTAVGSPLSIGSPTQIVTDPSGSFAFVASTANNLVTSFTINQATGALAAAVNTSAGVTGVSFLATDPLGTWLVAIESGGLVQIAVDAATGTLSPPTGIIISGTTSVAIHPGGRFLYSGSGSVVTLATITAPIVIAATATTVTVPGTVLGIGVDPSGGFAFVTSSNGNIYGFPINPVTGALVGPPLVSPTGLAAGGVVIDPSGQFGFVTSTTSGGLWGYTRSGVSGAQLLTIPGTPLVVGTTPSGPAVASTIQ